MEVQNKRFIIIGSGRSGIAATAFLYKKHAKVLLCDTKSYEALLKEDYGIDQIIDLEGVETIFGRQPSEEEIRKNDYLVLSPGAAPDIFPCNIARQYDIPIMSEIEFANTFYKGDVIAITGTNGKTTVTTLIGELLKDGNLETYVGGNIGDPFINHAEQASDNGVIALEISSFQLSMNQALKPKIAVITNITPDHLDRHKTMDNYIAAKANIFMNMEGDDIVILNYDDPIVRDFKKNIACKTYYFSLVEHEDMNAYLHGDDIFINIKGMHEKLINKNELHLLGVHNIANVMAGTLAALEYGVDINDVRDTLRRFTPVEHRLEFVAEHNGVTYINDSKGTNPDASMTAIRAIDQPLILIMGGYDKRSSFDEIFELIKQKVKHVVVLGETKHKILEEADRQNYTDITAVEDYEQAVKACVSFAMQGDCVLLSPACASWDMFENYEQRGQYFKKLVKEL